MDPLFAIILSFFSLSVGYLLGRKRHWLSDVLFALAWMATGVFVTLFFIVAAFITPSL